MKSISRSQVLVFALALGLSIAAGFLPGGYDAYYFFFRPPPENSLLPAWLYLVSIPLSWLGWPLSWQVLVFTTVLATALGAAVWGNRRWWIAVLSAAMLWNIWLGQIEVVAVAGLIAGGLVLQKKAHPAWLGAAWLAFATKPQVGLGPLLLITWWVWRDQGWKALLWGLAAALPVVAVTFALWPNWLARWIGNVLSAEHTPNWVAAVWPYGLVGIPLALIPQGITRVKRLRMVVAATLLASPYFGLYHTVALLALTPSPLALGLSWLLVFPANLLSRDWMTWGWILPAAVLGVDFVRCYLPLRGAPSQPAAAQTDPPAG